MTADAQLSDLLRNQSAETGRYLRAAGAALHALYRTPESLVELKSHSVEFVLYVINADVFPLAGASAGFIWLIVILIFRWIGAQVAQVRAKEEDESANHAPDQDNGQG